MCCVAVGLFVAAPAAGAGTAARAGAAAGLRAAKTSPRPAGPAADLSQELTGGHGIALASAIKVDLAAAGYVEHEYVAAGTATSYRAKGGLTRNGRWTFTDAGTAPYRTRVVVRRPASAADFSGTVVVEWLNVSAGSDADPVWSDTHEELMRRGDAWIGVSAQMIGVVGGPILTPAKGGATASNGIRGSDPARYGSLVHPGDGYSFDIYTQVAQALRNGGAALGGPKSKQVLAAGDSQSSYALVSYLDGVQPRTHEFDGFLVQSRGRTGLPLAAPGQPADLVAARFDPPPIIRTDTDVPVLEVQTESDLDILESLQARQPDNRHFRLWEVAGTAHADAHLLGPFASALKCGVPVNNAPFHIVLKAAVRALQTWVDTGTPPPRAPRITVTNGRHPKIARDADGIAEGGVRTPPVDVPVEVLSGIPGPEQLLLCQLFGSTTPLPQGRLAALYPSRDVYVQRYTAAVDRTIRAGFALPDDRDALLAYAQPSRIG